MGHIKQNNQWERIIFGMQQDSKRTYKISDFSKAPDKFNYQVGYKASTRFAELKKQGYIETADNSKKIHTYRLTHKGIMAQSINSEAWREKNMFLRAVEWLFN
jgi:hypothetical protein